MGSNRLSSASRDRLSTRIVHGSILKSEFVRAMDWIAKINPDLSYALRSGFRGMAFRFRSSIGPPPVRLRDDIGTYSHLFARASQNFSEVLTPYQSEIRWPRGRIFNNLFESVDAELYYSMIRFFRSARIIEVGSGNSTWFAVDALRENGKGTIISIDPKPRIALPRRVQVLKQPVEEVDLSIFHKLAANDILFVDASHTDQEARYATDCIYPLLEPGVLIHHHDISFPYLAFASVVRDLGESSEEAVILNFLASQREAYEIFTASAFVGYEDPVMVGRLVPSSRYARRSNQSSLWISKLPRPS